MSKRYSGKSFKDSSTAKKPKLSLKEKRKQMIIIESDLLMPIESYEFTMYLNLDQKPAFLLFLSRFHAISYILYIHT